MVREVKDYDPIITRENTSRVLYNLPKDRIIVFVKKPEIRIDVFDYLGIERIG